MAWRSDMLFWPGSHATKQPSAQSLAWCQTSDWVRGCASMQLQPRKCCGEVWLRNGNIEKHACRLMTVQEHSSMLPLSDN